jgi:23S rRNA (adenine2030-N6)-methyltransferase
VLSYQHAYHAGNPADVLKHALWAAVLEALTQKPKPLKVYETHAGRGVYPLAEAETQRGAEWQHGLGALALATLPGPFGDAVRALNPTGVLTTIPGSPAVAAHLLRSTDHLHLCELHPTERAKLHRWARGQANIHCHDDNGWVQIPALVKAGQRDVVLLDPSFERAEEYPTVTSTVQKILTKNPAAGVVVWLPILGVGKSKGQHQPVIEGLKALNVQATYLAQWRWAERFAGFALQGTAMVALNLPYGLETTLPPLLQAYAQGLALPRNVQTYTLLVARK